MTETVASTSEQHAVSPSPCLSLYQREVKERKSSLPRSRGCCRSPWCRSSIRTGTCWSASRGCWPAAIGSSTDETTWSTATCRQWRSADRRRIAATNRLSPCNSRRTFDTWSKPFCHQTWPSRAARAPSFPPTTSGPSGSPTPVSCTSVLARHSRTPVPKLRES